MSIALAGVRRDSSWRCCSRRCCPAIVNRVKAVFAGRRGPPLLQAYCDLVQAAAQGRGLQPTPRLGVPRRARRRPRRVALAACCSSRWAGAARSLGVRRRPGAVRPALRAGPVRHRARRAGHRLGLRGHGREPRGVRSRRSRSRRCSSPSPSLARLSRQPLAERRSLSTRRAGSVPVPRSSRPRRCFVVFLAENARIPVDDPNTHLELTMIHEVMVLDHGGPDLALIQYGAALKLWAFGSLRRRRRSCPAHGPLAARPRDARSPGCSSLAVVTGVVESTMARLRLRPRARSCSSRAAVLAVAVARGAGIAEDARDERRRPGRPGRLRHHQPVAAGLGRLRSCVRGHGDPGRPRSGCCRSLLGADLPRGAWRLQAALALALKGAVFPWLLLRAMRATRAHGESRARRSGYSTSLLVGVGADRPLALDLAAPAGCHRRAGPSLLVPAASSRCSCGLFLIVARRSRR